MLRTGRVGALWFMGLEEGVVIVELVGGGGNSGGEGNITGEGGESIRDASEVVVERGKESLDVGRL